MACQGHRTEQPCRSLRSTSRRLLETLVPVVYLKCGASVAGELHRRGDFLVDEADIIAWLANNGLVAAEARTLVETCCEAESLDQVRQEFGYDLPMFNNALRALAPEWQPLHFEDRLRQAF